MRVLLDVAQVSQNSPHLELIASNPLQQTGLDPNADLVRYRTDSEDRTAMAFRLDHALMIAPSLIHRVINIQNDATLALVHHSWDQLWRELQWMKCSLQTSAHAHLGALSS